MVTAEKSSYVSLADLLRLITSNVAKGMHANEYKLCFDPLVNSSLPGIVVSQLSLNLSRLNINLHGRRVMKLALYPS